jgi:hypothetical protein
VLDPRDVAELNQARITKLVASAGEQRTRELLEDAARDLQRRLAAMPARDTFTAEQMEVTLRQVKASLSDLTAGIQGTLVGTVNKASAYAADGVVAYMHAADKKFRGAGMKPLNLDEALMFDRAAQGSQSSLLNRLKDHPTRGKGILSRYGENTIQHFEGILQRGLLVGKSTIAMRDELTSASPFLQAAPKSWAQRIVRTEVMGGYARAAWESNREANDQLGDVVKVLSGIFDHRTAADSYSTHGQIRLPDEPFETWYGMMQHPPDRPNDRALVMTHRISWPIPKYLQAKSQAEVMLAWKREKRKGLPPPQPRISTVPLGQFGNPAE